MRYIDADELLEKAEEIEWFNEGTGYYDLINIVHKYDVETAPTADVAPKSYGKWKPYKDYFTHRQVGWICTNCSVVIRDLSNGDTNYCPYCGAIMETECEEEDE